MTFHATINHLAVAWKIGVRCCEVAALLECEPNHPDLDVEFERKLGSMTLYGVKEIEFKETKWNYTNSKIGIDEWRMRREYAEAVSICIPVQMSMSMIQHKFENF